MLIAAFLVQTVLLLAVLAVLLRSRANAAVPPMDNGRLDDIRDLVTRMDARFDGLNIHVRAGVDGMRRDLATEAHASRETAAGAFRELRAEILGSVTSLGSGLNAALESFRADNKGSAETLRSTVDRSLESIAQKISAATAESVRNERECREALHTLLRELADSNSAQQEKLRAAVEERLQQLNQNNTEKLEQMRVTVDEKLQATLNERLTRSFGQVTTHLGEVQKGLGEMKELATGVGDLKKVLSNVKSRGIVGEFQLGQQLEQMFSPEQYIRNARIKSATQETVEFALKVPNGPPGNFVLLAIDAKFPKDDWERLEHAYEHGNAEEIATAGRAFERAIRTEAKRICDKYIDPPITMPHAIMFLPTENLYAEVVRRPGLMSEIQSNCRVTIAGPSTFMAILTSFQMGFHTMAIQKKGDEVWRVLSKTKTEFTNFEGLLGNVVKQVGTVQNTLDKIRSKTTTINRALKNVSSTEAEHALDDVSDYAELPGMAPLLAAVAEER